MSNAFDIVKACKKYGVKNIDQLVKILWEGIEKKDQQIAELQAKDKELEEKQEGGWYKPYKNVMKANYELFKDNQNLKHQLQAQPKQIVDWLKEEAIKDTTFDEYRKKKLKLMKFGRAILTNC